MQMEMFTKESGKMIKLMGMANICILMELSMRDTGKRINNMEKVKKHGQMEPAMRETT